MFRSPAPQALKAQGRLSLDKVMEIREAGVDVASVLGEDARQQLYRTEVGGWEGGREGGRVEAGIGCLGGSRGGQGRVLVQQGTGCAWRRLHACRHPHHTALHKRLCLTVPPCCLLFSSAFFPAGG